MTLRPICLVCCLLLAAAAQAGEALRVEPGKWEVTTESTNSMQPEPRVTTRTECVTEGEWDPDTLMQGTEGCSVSEVTSSADRLQWKVRCESQGGVMTGQADYRAKGDRVEGTMHMSMDMGGMKMTLDHAYSGERVGDCD